MGLGSTPRPSTAGASAAAGGLGPLAKSGSLEDLADRASDADSPGKGTAGARGRVQIRDLRLLDDASNRKKPAIWTRHSAILVSLPGQDGLGGTRAAIMRQRMLVFFGDRCNNTDINERSDALLERLREFDTGATESERVLPWEFRALEVVIEDACSALEADFAELESDVHDAIAAVERNTVGALIKMHSAKRDLLRYVTRAADVVQVLEDVVENEDEKIEMHLSDKFYYESNRRFTKGQTFQEWKRVCTTLLTRSR